YDLDTAGRQPRQVKHRNNRRGRQRFLDDRLDSRQNFQELGKTETHVKVLQSDRARGLCRIGDFVGLIRVGESDGERLDPVRGMLLRAGRDQRRIDTTTQKDAHFDVRKQLALDRLLQQ